MINHVVAKNFKGRDIDVEIGPKTLICGPNGTGKSAIVQALELAINGYISGGIYKTNAAILETFGRGEKLTVEASIAHRHPDYSESDKYISTQLARQFSMDSRGAVNQLYLVDRRRSDQKAFMVAAGSAGAPKVVVVDDFLQLSPSKMIGYLAAFTGGQEIEELGSKIVTEKERLNKARSAVNENEVYISRTMKGIADLGLPAGTLAEVQDSIKSVTKELAKAKADLKEAEKAEADRLAEEKRMEAYREAELKQKVLEDNARQAVESRKEEPAPAGLKQANVPPPKKTPAPKGVATYDLTQEGLYPTQEEKFGGPHEPWRPHQGPTAISSLKRILDAIDGLQCPVCKHGFVRLVVLNEMKKWEGK